MKNQPSHIQDYTPFSKDDIFQLMLNNISESFVLLDTDLVIVESNKTAREWSWSKAGRRLFPGSNFMDSVDANDISWLRAIFAEVLKGNLQKTEYAYLLPDGTTRHLENNMLPAKNNQGEIIGIIIHSKDTTEKKKVESAIKEAEERWQFAFDASNQAAWDWNMETNEVIYSSSYKKMYGFVDEDLESDIKEWNSRIHPDDKKKIEIEIEKHIASQNPLYETTYRIQLKNGDYKWILARGKLVSKDANGKPLRMIGTHTDLTETLKAEEEIKKMNERFIYASKASSQALWEWDAITGQAYVSPSFTEVFGWEADQDNYFEQWHKYIHPEDKKATISSYYETLEKTTASIWEAEYRFLKKDGSYAVVADKAFILRNKEGQVIKVIGATQDISAQKQTEDELSRSNERYNLMLQATNELLWEWDMNTMEVYRSGENFKKVYGLDDYSLVKTHEQWLNRLHPEDRDKVEKTIEKVFLASSDRQTFEMEYRFLNGNGGYNYIRGRGLLLTDENGKPVRMIGTEQNISERKRLEQELLKHELEYKKLINQATVDSQEQERSEIGRELHDNINQVLTTTKLYLELAIANEDMMKELVKKSSRNISSVINEIRELSRSLMDPTIGDLGIVDSINDLIENINLTRKVHINLQIDDSIENLLDRNQKLTIFRIIQESLNNVIRHAKAKLVTIFISVQDENVRLTIADDGIGFSNDSIKKGAGLKNITNRVYLINGNFRIDSKPGQGCQIKIT
ncbi:MAG TPA: PAS domain-containing protein, partial [Flavisolibacter sp.]|nr:PAS domain-containing protein [Flavisolibacter sp.]